MNPVLRSIHIVVFAALISVAGANVGSGARAGEIDYKAAAEAAMKGTEGQAADTDARADRNAALDFREKQWVQEFRQRSYEWHLLSTKIIFLLVVGIVAFGLFITYLQFSRDYTDASYHAKPGLPTDPAVGGDAAAPLPAPPSKTVTSLKLGPGGLELSSQIIGLVVLAFSLGFFYLYVKNVYPMNEEQVSDKATTAQERSAASPQK